MTHAGKSLLVYSGLVLFLRVILVALFTLVLRFPTSLGRIGPIRAATRATVAQGSQDWLGEG